jgi:hypothetical protein
MFEYAFQVIKLAIIAKFMAPIHINLINSGENYPLSNTEHN